jgi:hypothetical protein
VGLLLFRTEWPQGAAGVNTSYVNGTGVYGPNTPLSQFPSFLSAGALGEQLGWLIYSGIWTLWEVWGVGTSHGYMGGNGPVTFYNTTFAPAGGAPAGAPSKPTALVACQFDNFKTSVHAVVGAPVGPAYPRWVFGTMGTVVDIEPGFAVSVGLWGSTAGINDATFAWGAVMRRAYGTERMPPAQDLMVSKLSAYTDNGAVYFQGYWDMVCPTRNCSQAGTNAEQLMIAWKDYFSREAIPVSLYQLDTWWFVSSSRRAGAGRGGGRHGLLLPGVDSCRPTTTSRCRCWYPFPHPEPPRFPLVQYQGADVQPSGGLDCADWTPRADMWPHGLPYVTQHDIPLQLYSWGFITPEKGQRMLNWTWVPSFPQYAEAMVALDEVYAFYSMIRDRFLAYNGSTFEEDDIGTMTGAYAQTLHSTFGASAWWAGFALPWCEAGIPVQICESEPSDILESLKYNCVTNSRDNIDNVPGSHQTSGNSHPAFLVRWRVGFDRMLLAALDVAPFFDNVWTMPSQPGSSWYPAAETYTEMQWVLSVLTAGPVGIGDIVGNTNASLVMTACSSDGTLLKPSVPSIYIEAVYLQGGAAPWDVSKGRIFQATWLPTRPAPPRRARAPLTRLRPRPSSPCWPLTLAPRLACCRPT